MQALLEAEGPGAVTARRLGAAVGIGFGAPAPAPAAELPPARPYRLPSGLEARAAAPLIAACGGDPHLAPAAWGTINGLIDLELAAHFPPDTDLDAVYAAATRVYNCAVARR